MKKYINKYKIELLIITTIIFLSLINLKLAYLLNDKYQGLLTKQLMWILIGIFISIIIYKIKLKTIYKYRYIIYTFSILLLIYPLIFSKDINRIKAWIKIGPIVIQPSELMKIAYPIVAINLIKYKKYLLSFILYLIPTILIIIEPDTGNALFLTIIFIYLILNKKNTKYIFLTIFITTMISTFVILSFKYYPQIYMNLFNGSLYYRLKRILSFNNNYQLNNALIGIGSSKLLPNYINKKLLIYIPEGITDFIFSFSVCNLGIIVNILLILLYIIFIYILIKRFYKTRYIYQKKLLGSFIIIFSFQFVYNIFMNIGLVPIIGIPLPLFSYGGSNIITYLILYFLTTKKLSSIEDKDNNNYKSNYHMDLVDNK